MTKPAGATDVAENMEAVGSRFPPSVVEEVDEWAASQPARTTRSAAILALTCAGLATLGRSRSQGRAKK